MACTFCHWVVNFNLSLSVQCKIALLIKISSTKSRLAFSHIYVRNCDWWWKKLTKESQIVQHPIMTVKTNYVLTVCAFIDLRWITYDILISKIEEQLHTIIYYIIKEAVIYIIVSKDCEVFRDLKLWGFISIIIILAHFTAFQVFNIPHKSTGNKNSNEQTFVGRDFSVEYWRPEKQSTNI